MLGVGGSLSVVWMESCPKLRFLNQGCMGLQVVLSVRFTFFTLQRTASGRALPCTPPIESLKTFHDAICGLLARTGLVRRVYVKYLGRMAKVNEASTEVCVLRDVTCPLSKVTVLRAVK